MFKVEEATAEDLQIQVDVGALWRVNPAEPHPKRETFTERLTLLALGRLAALGREHVDELLSEKMKYPTYAISIDEGDADELRRLPGTKGCRYQSTRKGGLYCSVATGPVADRLPGLTTRHLCGGCSMPDSRLACSHLHHPFVEFVPGDMPAFTGAHCDIGRSEMNQDASRFRPGGHDCWVKEVEFAAAGPKAVSPLALHESFDYFDALWKNVFKSHVLRMRAASVLGKLATPCATQSEFEVKLSALADLINSLEVADDDLSPEHRQSDNHKKGRTLARVESALVRRVTEAGLDGAERIKAAVTVLRNAMALRRGYQHTGDASGKLPQAFSSFGLGYPPSSGEVAWQRVQKRVLDALSELRDVLRDLE